jgi:dolichol-phosphate mannosyltransferase
VSISVVIPLCDEVESLRALHQELAEAAQRQDDEFEFIFVDDGSTDGSWDVIRQLAVEDRRVRGIRFRSNFGKAAALTAGFEAASGELILTMDADLQDDPHEISRFLAAIDDGEDLVCGWKKIRHDPWHKVLPSRVFNWMIGVLTGVRLHDHNCGMKCYRREVLDEIELHGGMYRFAAVLAAARGYKVAEVVVHHRPRKFGHSHYGFSRFFKGTLDLITVWFRTQFGDKPQYLFGTVAALLLVFGLMGASFGWSWFAFAAVLIAVQLFATGLIAEVVAAKLAPATRSYSIAECVGDELTHQVPLAPLPAGGNGGGGGGSHRRDP